MWLLSKLFKSIIKIVPKDKIFLMMNWLLLLYLPKANNKIKPGSVVMVGMLRASSGLGQAARLTMSALMEQGYKVTSFDVSNLFVDQFLDIKLPELANDEEGGVIIIQNNPIHIPLILFLLGRKKLKNRKIIAYSVWETESIPDSWIRPCELVHEIWSPSDFSAQAFRNKLRDKPVTVVPHPLRKHEKNVYTKQHFGLPDNKVIIFSMADLASGFVRKNVTGVIEAFKKINTQKQEAVLALKLSGTKRCIEHKALIGALIKNISDIIIIESFLSDEEIQGLIALSDIVMSIHRSEGFGLLMAEAMWHGKTIIATPWSANLTFLPESCACYVKYNLVKIEDCQNIYKDKGVWAEPDIDDVAEKLSALISDNKLREELGVNARKYAAKFFTKKAFAEQTQASLSKYALKS